MYYSHRLSRWAMKLSEYNVQEIDYKPGNTNIVADSLSHLPDKYGEAMAIVLEDHAGLQLDFVAQHQKKDDDVSRVITFLTKKDWPDNLTKELQPFFSKIEYFVLIDDVLYLSNRKKNVNPVRPDHLLLVIPKSLKLEILCASHGEPTAGHFNFRETMDRIANRYY